MNEAIELRWQQLQQQKELFLAELDSWPAELLSVKPPSGSWSALQVLEHIQIAETGTLAYMKKKTSGGWEVLELTGDSNRAASSAVNERLRSPEKYSAPSVLPEPGGHFPYAGMKNHWDQMRKELYTFMASLDEAFYDRLVFRQPNAGLLNLFQALEFMTHHIEHHIPQLHRIREEIG